MNFFNKKVDQSKFLRFFVVALSLCTKVLVRSELVCVCVYIYIYILHTHTHTNTVASKTKGQKYLLEITTVKS